MQERPCQAAFLAKRSAPKELTRMYRIVKKQVQSHCHAGWRSTRP